MADDFKITPPKPPKKRKKKITKKGGKVGGISTPQPRNRVRPPRESAKTKKSKPKSTPKPAPKSKPRNRSEAAKKGWETRRAKGWKPKPLTDEQRAERSRRMKEYWKRKKAEGWKPKPDQKEPEPEIIKQEPKPETEPLDRTEDIDDYEPDEVTSEIQPELDELDEADEDEILDGDAAMYDSVLSKIDAVVKTGERDELTEVLKELLDENINQYGSDFFDYLNDHPEILDDLDIVFYESSDDKDAEVDKVTEAAVRIATVLSGGEFAPSIIERIRTALYADYDSTFYVESWTSPYDD